MGPLQCKRLWLGFGLLLIAVVTASSLIDLGSTGRFLVHDKLVHLTAYAGLMGWFSQLFRSDLTRLLLAIGFVMLGISIEFLQALTPSRQFEIFDMIANSSGVLLAWALSYTWVGRVLPAIERALLRIGGATV